MTTTGRKHELEDPDNCKHSKRRSIIDYYDAIQKAAEYCDQPKEISQLFDLPLKLPPLTQEMIEFFRPATISHSDIDPYKGVKITLLDLMNDPATQTTKSFASLGMVARAVHHIKSTGESIAIITPSSANKGTALRSAVERAIKLGLVASEQLRIITILPENSIAKCRQSALTSDAELKRLNPLFIYQGEDPEHVKQIGRQFVSEYTECIHKRYGLRLWYTLNLENYRSVDSVRAFYDHENIRPHSSKRHINAHAVSSAFGLLGYRLGRHVLESEGMVSSNSHPGYLLVQHLATPDMVVHNLFGDFSREHIPQYELDMESGIYKQCTNSAFPYATYDVEESLDSTFYSRSPATSELLDQMITRFGGGGIVVSLLECLERYPLTRLWLNKINYQLPSDPRKLREWSLIMVFTGVLNAIDRGIITADSDVLIHGSGFYTKDDYQHLSATDYHMIEKNDAVERIGATLAELY